MTPNRTFDEQKDLNLGPVILIVEDEDSIRLSLKQLCLQVEGVQEKQVLLVSTLSQAFEIAASNPIDVVLLDKNLKHGNGEEDGIQAIPELLQIRPHAQIIVVSGSRDSQDIVQAMRYGAFGFVGKGTDDEILPSQIQKAFEVAKLSAVKATYQRTESTVEHEFVGKSPATKRLIALLPQLSETDGTVLLLGESGTGKTTLAKQIHRYREHYLKQANRPFIYVNVGALSPTLIERELFGNEPGAFTGAGKGVHQGFFELANKGTLFLDEIGNISLDVQAKLLEILQEGTFYRVGGTKKLSTSFKLICATNKDLATLVSRGEFREDLYWRIAALPIELPPLKERREDIPDLVRSLLPKICKQIRVQVSFEELPGDFLEYLVNAPPEGNARGIEQKLTQLLTLSPKDRKGERLLSKWKSIPELSPVPIPKRSRSGMTVKEWLSSSIDTSDPDFPGFTQFIQEIERKIFLDAKSRYKQNRQISKVLRICDSAVSNRMRRLDVVSVKEVN